LSSITSLWIRGDRVQPLFSDFRSSWIIKLWVDASRELVAARESLQQALATEGLRGVIPSPANSAVPVTVLESIDAPTPKSEGRGDLPHVTSLRVDSPRVALREPVSTFLDTVIVSRIKAAFDYEILESWRLASR
jgi:hypothetical protein